MESAIKFYVFHQRHLGKSAYIEKGTAPAEYAVIAASNSQQNACVMSKAVRESINQACAAGEFGSNRQRHSDQSMMCADLIQTFQWQSGIDMDKPKDLPARGARAGIHLPGTTAIALDKPITKSGGEPIRAIGASAVRDNDLGFWRSLAQMLKKWPYQRRLVKNRDDDRDLRPNAFLQNRLTKRRLRDRVFVKAALEFTTTGRALITGNFRPAATLAQNFAVKQK